MNQPKSIVDFGRCYLAAFVITVINTVLSWQRTAELTAAQAAQLGSWFLPVVTLIGFLITLSIWYFITRRHSVVAKWVATVFLVLGLLGLLVSVPMGTYPKGINGVLGIVATVLQAIAVYLLFQPDAKAWFGEKATTTI